MPQIPLASTRDQVMILHFLFAVKEGKLCDQYLLSRGLILAEIHDTHKGSC